MKKQILIIHGGMTHNSDKDFLLYLKTCKVEDKFFRLRTDWKSFIGKKLGENYDVLIPTMPNKLNSKYEEWKIWFNRITPFIKNNIILVGHSLGGIFLAKYLSENIYSKKIKALILVAAPYDATGSDESFGDFILPKSLKKIEKQVKNIYLFQSRDDVVVPFEQVNKYKVALPNAEVVALNDRKHFNQESFPELVKLIKEL